MFDIEFYPTPSYIAHKMLSKVSKEAEHFLEPSAGKGDIATVIKGQERYSRRNVDCIEQSPELVAILNDKGFPVVGHDWLEYSGVCYYDAILMNPPFSNGDDHLLKAWDFLHNGEIVCLLNEETINNPHTAARQRLAEIIAQHGSVEYLGDCFSNAQRKTGVNVAMVYLKKQAEDDRLDLWAKGGEEKTASGDIGETPSLPALIDRLGNMQHFYDQANEHMLKAFQHIRKASLFLAANDISLGYADDGYKKASAIAFENVNSARAEFGRKHRRDAWMQVFNKMEFRKWLDKKQTEEFVRDIERNGNIPFTKENIKGTLENVFLQRGQLFEKSVANVFDELTKYQNGNTNHTEGWKTNDSYKVNQKLVFPWGCTFSYGSFSTRYDRGIDIYNDLDRIMCVLDGKDFAECHTIQRALDNKFRILGHDVKSPFDNTTESHYFEIRFFKKGTVHLKFKDKHLWERFNVTAAKGKNWIGQQTQGAGAG